MTDNPSHCWADPRDGLELWESIDVPGATCLLADGHDGPHEFVPDFEVTVRFRSVTDNPVSLDQDVPREPALLCRVCTYRLVEWGDQPGLDEPTVPGVCASCASAGEMVEVPYGG